MRNNNLAKDFQRKPQNPLLAAYQHNVRVWLSKDSKWNDCVMDYISDYSLWRKGCKLFIYGKRLEREMN